MEHGGNVELLAPRYGFDVSEVLDFSANINPYGPPADFQLVIEECLSTISRYPDPNSTRAKEALAEYHCVSPENIVVANGASELVAWFPYIYRCNRALIFAPAFTEYTRSIELSGGEVFYEFVSPSPFPSPIKGEGVRRAGEGDAISNIFSSNNNTKRLEETRPQLTFIGNPNNPTGILHSHPSFAEWIEQSAYQFPDTLFVIDESFMPFTGTEKHSLISFAVKTPQVLVLRSLTKILAIPGLRAGYAVGHPFLIEKLDQTMPVWRMNTLAQRFCERILHYQSFIQASSEKLQRERRKLIKEIGNIRKLKAYKSNANFILVKILEASLKEIIEGCGERGILIRDCTDFVGLEKERFFRIAVRKPEENQKLLKTLSEVCQNAK